MSPKRPGNDGYGDWTYAGNVDAGRVSERESAADCTSVAVSVRMIRFRILGARSLATVQAAGDASPSAKSLSLALERCQFISCCNSISRALSLQTLSERA